MTYWACQIVAAVPPKYQKDEKKIAFVYYVLFPFLAFIFEWWYLYCMGKDIHYLQHTVQKLQ